MNGRSGFTLLEILVVVMIITILATIVGVKVAQEPGRARVSVARTQLQVFRTALQRYHMDHGAYPAQAQGLDALCHLPKEPPVPATYPEGGYLDRANVPRDPWNNEYVYLVPGANGEPFEVLSYGVDGEPGGEGEAADILSSQM